MVKIGDEVIITAIDNENYSEYLDIKWTVEAVDYSKDDHPGYDPRIGGPLISCEGLPFSLYEFEFEVV